MKIINLYGAPATGKTTTASYIFYYLKKKRKNVYLLKEFASELIAEGRLNELKNQLWILGETIRKIELVKDRIDYIVTDSPIMLNAIYASDLEYKNYQDLAWHYNKRYESIDILLDQKEDMYSPEGRLQNYEECKEIQNRIKKLLNNYNIDYYSCPDLESIMATLHEECNI